MAVLSQVFAGLASDTNHGPSPNVWKGCPWLEALENPNIGGGFYDDFVQFPAAGAAVTVTNIGNYRRFGDTGSTITDAAIIGGGIKFTCANADESTNLQSLVAPYQIDSSHGKLWYEAGFSLASVAATTANVFVGLMDTTAGSAIVPITTTDDTMADVNFLGFIVKSTGIVDFRYKADGQTVQNPIATLTTLTAGTLVKLGFVYDPTVDTAKRIACFINGVEQTTYITGTNIAAATFPNDVLMAPVLAHTNMATKTTSTFDFHRVFQKWVN